MFLKRGCRRGFQEFQRWTRGRYVFRWEECKTEMINQCRLAAPMIALGLSQEAFEIISVVFVGRVGALALAASSIATSIANMTGLCIMNGMASGLETLCGQAYGAEQYHLLGHHLHAGVLCLNILAVLLSFVYAYMGEILIELGQDKTISLEAGKYAKWLIPTLFAQASLQPLARFLLAQSLVGPLMTCAGIAATFHLPLCWILVQKTSFGFTGAALSTSISCWMYVILLYIYTKFSSSCLKANVPLSTQPLKVLATFLRFALPSAAMACLDWWCYDIMLLLCGLLPDPELQTSSLSICINYANINYQVAAGLAAAVSTRVSNELGAGNSLKASNAATVSIILTECQGFAISILVHTQRRFLGHIFSKDAEVVEHVATVLHLVAFSSMLDSTQGVISGIARGCGWQGSGALINLSSHYGVALPVGACLAFLTPLQAQGLWIGIICGLVLQVVLLSRLTLLAKWDQEVACVKFIESQGGNMEPSDESDALILL